MQKGSFEKAAELFDDWYQFCLENGVEPEKVVEAYGEMLLITDSDMIEKISTIDT